MSNRLRELREEKGLSLKELVDDLRKVDLKISSDTLAKYERGEREPKLERWQKLADYFDVSVEYLLGIEGTNYSYNLAFSKILDKYDGVSSLKKDEKVKLVGMKIDLETLFSFLVSPENKSNLAVEKNIELLKLISKIVDQMSVEFLMSSLNRVERVGDGSTINSDRLINVSDKYINLFSDMLNKMNDHA